MSSWLSLLTFGFVCHIHLAALNHWTPAQYLNVKPPGLYGISRPHREAPFLGEKFTFFGWPLRTLTVFKNVIKKPINAKFSTKSGVHQKIPWQIAVGVRLQKVHCPLPRGPSSLRLPFIFATNTKFSVWLKPRYFHFTSFVLLAGGLCSGAGSPAKQ